jgi:hypothetical protein
MVLWPVFRRCHIVVSAAFSAPYLFSLLRKLMPVGCCMFSQSCDSHTESAGSLYILYFTHTQTHTQTHTHKHTHTHTHKTGPRFIVSSKGWTEMHTDIVSHVPLAIKSGGVHHNYDLNQIDFRPFTSDIFFPSKEN